MSTNSWRPLLAFCVDVRITQPARRRGSDAAPGGSAVLYVPLAHGVFAPCTLPETPDKGALATACVVAVNRRQDGSLAALGIECATRGSPGSAMAQGHLVLAATSERNGSYRHVVRMAAGQQ